MVGWAGGRAGRWAGGQVWVGGCVSGGEQAAAVTCI